MVLKALPVKHCERCGWDWVPRVLRPRVCPKCHSPYFDVMREKRA